MLKIRNLLLELAVVVIITIPAFISLLNSGYLPMHDDQHVVRLYLLDQGIRQGSFYPRWVGGLGFSFGYPLYNFYPPLIYYVAEVFHLVGLSYIASIKAVIIVGFIFAAFGIYLLVKKMTKSRVAGILSSTLYTYFFYQAVLIYVRGALAEFFTLAILPFLFLAFHNLANRNNWLNGIIFGVTFALLILTHPLIALPTVFFLTFFFIFYFLKSSDKLNFFKISFFGIITGLSLSAFFWLPSFFERKYTLVDKILTGELANYKLHYIEPMQFIYSPWGYGGSTYGTSDGLTFQLGKVHLSIISLALIFSFIYWIKKRKHADNLGFYFLVFLLLFSIFMTTRHSSIIWDNSQFLWYLQFPWRFLTFVTLFIAMVGGHGFLFIDKLFQPYFQPRGLEKALLGSITVVLIISTILIYQKYFKPQYFIKTSDKEKTSLEEINWRISGTSYEFVPKGVKTKKSSFNTTILDLKQTDLAKQPFEVILGEMEVVTIQDKFERKDFEITAYRETQFKLNTFNFPGWTAYLNRNKIKIKDDNDFRLIAVDIPPGKHKLSFRFEDTPVRMVANSLSLLSGLSIAALLFYKFKKVNS